MTMSPPSERTNVIFAAKAYAEVLRSDPVMARQLKEHISVGQLLELLDLTEEEVCEAFRIRNPDADDE